MNSREYWKKRTGERFTHAETELAEAQRELEQSFRQSLRELEDELNRFYGRYARNNPLTLSEAQKALSASELRGLKDDLAGFRKLAIDSMSSFNLELDNLSVQARATRLQALKCQMDAVVERLYGGQRELIGGTAAATYSDQYHRTLFDIDRYTGFHQEFAQLSDAAIRRVVNYPFDGAMFSERLWRQSEDLKPQIQQLVTRSLLTGRPPQDYADELARRFQVKAREAYRLLYTEGAFVTNQAHADAYAEDGIERYEYDAALDTTTCGICGELDGKTFALAERRVGENAPPMHPWCRCVTVPVVEGFVDDSTRFARDADGKAIEVPADMTYAEWKKKYMKGSQKSKTSDIIEPKRGVEVLKVKTGGIRNEAPLTAEQIREVTNYAIRLGMPEDHIYYVDYDCTGYGAAFDLLRIGTDAYPSLSGDHGPNSKVSAYGAIAHEIVGHREASLKSWTQDNDILGEAQASFRAARFAQGLTEPERIVLIRDGLQRLRNQQIKLSTVRAGLHIQER